MKRMLMQLGLIGALLLAAVAHATTPEEAQKVFDTARQAATLGPHDVALAGQAVLKLPAGTLFIPQPQATTLLNAMGNPGQDDRLQGLVFPQGDAGWFMTVRFESSGYIKDDDAKEWNAEELLKNYREGTEASNEARVKMGSPAIEVLGWAEVPAYDATSHRLAWAMSSRHKNAAADEPQGVNYNTYLLGREGYFSMNLVTALNELPAHKPAAQALLAALAFDDGKRYADFKAGTDKVAEYGLAALVVGVAAKKLGLIALALAFVAKFAKVIFLAVAGFGALGAKLWRKKPVPSPVSTAEAAPPPAPAPPSA
jgi:uncharacterized membrane-anchored protein